LSISEKDRLVKMVEKEILGVDGVEAVFAFTGPGGFTNADGLGDANPIDTIGGIQIKLLLKKTKRKMMVDVLQ
jgi:hypothetical protein